MSSIHEASSEEARRNAVVRRMNALSNYPPGVYWMTDRTKRLSQQWDLLVKYAGSLLVWQLNRDSDLQYVLEKIRDEVRAEVVTRDPDFRYRKIDWTNDDEIITAFPWQGATRAYIKVFPSRGDVLEGSGLDEWLRRFIGGGRCDQESVLKAGADGDLDNVLAKLAVKYRAAVQARASLGF